MARSVKRSPLHSLHRTLGARMTEFGGFEMPLSYSGIIEEHRSVRAAAGLFDLSHMGEFELSGEGALATLEHALTNSAARLGEGHAQYTLMCAEDGGTLDDLIVYRLDSARYMLCVNAANTDSDREWLHAHAHEPLEMRDISDETGLVALQGPAAPAILARLARTPLAGLRRFHCARGEVAGIACLVARTGYTGEDGFEMFAAAGSAARLFEAILAEGAADGLKPCGLGARDTLRMEAGLPLYGHELDRAISPLEGGLAPFVKLGREFIGCAALEAQRAGGLKRHLAGFETDDGRSIARQGYGIFRDGKPIGRVTSGTFAPSFSRPLAIGMVDTEAAIAPGAQVEIEIRQRMAPATARVLPFYRRSAAAGL